MMKQTINLEAKEFAWNLLLHHGNIVSNAHSILILLVQVNEMQGLQEVDEKVLNLQQLMLLQEEG